MATNSIDSRMHDKSKTYAIIATAAVVALTILWMVFDSISPGDRNQKWPPRHDSDIVIDNEYAEIFDLPLHMHPASSDPSPAKAAEEADNQAEAAPETGMETIDEGDPGEAPATVTQDSPSPVKAEKKEKQEKQGPSAEEIKKQREEEARRKATRQTQDAFRNSGKNNTSNTGKNAGDAGKPDGSRSAVNGRGTGSVGGGWSLPHYNDVPSTVTGSVTMMVKIDRTGRVTSVTFQGGDAPAATNPDVRAACEKEVRAKRFTRADDNAPEESTAYITYRFR